MRKGFFAICSVLLVLVVSLAVLVPGCEGEPTTGTIEVNATLDGVPWPSSGTGAVTYSLTGPGTPPTGTDSVPKTFTVDPGSWNCTYVSGGPPAAYFVNITPSEIQSVAAGETKTFTLNFVTYAASPVNASITFKTWTVNGQPVVGPGPIPLFPEDYVDIEYEVHVSGAQGAHLRVKETSWLSFHYTEGEEPSVNIHAVNAWAAVQMNPPAKKLSQMTTIGGANAPACTKVVAWQCEPVLLDVETEWKLVVCNNYTKTINWISFPSWPDILFDLQIIPAMPFPTMALTAWSCVELDQDTDPLDDCTGNSTIFITLMP
jgi:hypothetical protein